MFRGRNSAGFTITELLIFLAVSAALFVSAMAMISGRQARTEFQQSVSTLQSQLNDITNDVNTGYYATPPSMTCQATSSSITIGSGGPNKQGSNTGCIFVGKAIQFGPSNTADQTGYNVITLAGRRTVDPMTFGSREVQTIGESGIKSIVQVNGKDAYATTTIDGGASFGCVWYGPVPVTKPCVTATNKTDVVALVTGFNASDVAIGASDGAVRGVSIIVPTTGAGMDRSVTTAANSINDYPLATKSLANPSDGVSICLQSNGTDQHAILRFGGNNNVTTSTVINNGPCS